jgi:PIN domain nuclease of toxin-antitoxin system
MLPENRVSISAATVWEIAIKRAIGRLEFPLDRFDEIIQRMSFDMLPIGPAHAIAAAGLPRHHNDPFDRMLIGQAMVENLVLVSRDPAISKYQVPLFGLAAG